MIVIAAIIDTVPSSWTDRATEELRAAGYRGGGARSTVIAYLARQDCCLSAQEIFDGVRGERPVGIASIYRTLDLLLELRLVQKVDLGGGTARYERAAGYDHHHHVVCGDCGKVEPFSDERLETAMDALAGTLGYELDAHDVVLRGACADCRAA